MKKLRIAVILALLFGLLVVGSASALDVVSYTDTGEVAVGDVVDEYWFAPDEDDVGTGSLIANGDFSEWDGGPTGWTLWPDAPNANWEARAAMVDLSFGAGNNHGLGFFIRNVGGAGHQEVGAYQALDETVGNNYYWVVTHASMFGDYDFFQAFNLIFVDDFANAFAWYAISTESDPSAVTDWREMFPINAIPGVLPCPNVDEACIYVGRYETVWIDAGSYFHVKAAHKYPAFNDWTVFVFDDISIVPAEGDVIEDGFWADGGIFWNEEAER